MSEATTNGPRDPMNERLTFTVDEVARLLGVSRSGAYDSITRGEIPSFNIGRRVLVPRDAFLKDGKTVVYFAMWREHAQGRELSRSFERQADAERHLVDMQHRLLTGTYAPPRLGRMPFSEVALRYRQRGNWRPRTHRTVEERLRYAIAHFGDRPIASIRKGGHPVVRERTAARAEHGAGRHAARLWHVQHRPRRRSPRRTEPVRRRPAAAG
ncbi:MAG: helix-turn-helix domain-containing protein [Ilumatobacteraceae bacterium]